MKKNGTVYLVGAGPGDPELITLKARRLINEADCVIYDYLAEKNFVKDLNSELIYAGKQGGNHTLTQDEINDLIIQRAKEGKNVLRLKGGDPFIFGRGGEEAERLIEEGINFEVVPGISSFYSAPAYAGIPLTHRDFARSFEVITGHTSFGSGEPDDVDLPEYDPHKTFVFLMGMKNLQHIQERLVEVKGFPTDMPVAIISWGTRPEQQVVTSNLGNLLKKVEESRIKPPAIIIMGGVVSLRDKLRWFDKSPLFGKKIVVTRTRKQASSLSDKLSALGARVLEFPTIEIQPAEDMTELQNALSNLKSYHWLVFTSQNGVEIFFKELFAQKMDVRALGQIKIAVIGKATGDELLKYGLVPDLVPTKFVQESLLEFMKDAGVQGKRILFPCAGGARSDLEKGLESAGADVHRIEVYNSVKPELFEEDFLEEVRTAHMATFASSSAVENFFEIVPSIEGQIAVIGPVTASAVKGRGLEVAVESEVHSIAGLVDSLLKFYGGDEQS